MTDAEALMWRLEKDPYLSSTVANVTVLDQPADMERFRDAWNARAAWCPGSASGSNPTPGLTPPVWVDDPEFDIDYHVRHVALPSRARCASSRSGHADRAATRSTGPARSGSSSWSTG